MVTRSRASDPRPFRLGWWATRLIGPLAVTALTLLGASLISRPADARRLCGDRSELLKQLEQGHQETPRALGLSTDGGVLEILVSPEGGWTMLVTYPRRATCVVAVGEAWQMLQLAGAPA